MRRALRISLAAATVAMAGCGSAAEQAPSAAHSAGSGSGSGGSSASAGSGGLALHGHPQAVDPVAGAAAGGTSPATGAPPAGVTGSAQPIPDSQIRSELAASGITANPDQATLIPGGLAIAPIAAPAAVQEVINAGNQIARLPYRFGGGHGTFEDSEYDCSGSLSFVLAAAGLLNTTVTSGELMSWGAPGPGKWITIFANPGHTFMYVAGLRFDTVALAQTGSRWSNRSATERDGFAVRHPPGL